MTFSGPYTGQIASVSEQSSIWEPLMFIISRQVAFYLLTSDAPCLFFRLTLTSANPGRLCNFSRPLLQWTHEDPACVPLLSAAWPDSCRKLFREADTTFHPSKENTERKVSTHAKPPIPPPPPRQWWDVTKAGIRLIPPMNTRRLFVVCLKH